MQANELRDALADSRPRLREGAARFRLSLNLPIEVRGNQPLRFPAVLASRDRDARLGSSRAEDFKRLFAPLSPALLIARQKRRHGLLRPLTEIRQRRCSMNARRSIAALKKERASHSLH